VVTEISQSSILALLRIVSFADIGGYVRLPLTSSS
jgi:hypothetical protein